MVGEQAFVVHFLGRSARPKSQPWRARRKRSIDALLEEELAGARSLAGRAHIDYEQNALRIPEQLLNDDAKANEEERVYRTRERLVATTGERQVQ